MRPTLIFAFTAASFAQTYVDDIQPLLYKRCGACHTLSARTGDFSMNTFEDLMRGGNHGRPIVPGNADDSLLVQMITGKANPTMPMDGTFLSAGEIELVKKWINAGAKGPAPGTAVKAPPADVAPPLKPRGAATARIYASAWQPGGALIALAAHKRVRLMPSRTRQGIVELEGAADAVRNVAFSPDGKFVASAGGVCAKSGEVKVWNVETRAVATTIHGHADCVYGLAFSPDGKTIATGSYDKMIKLWDAASGKEIRTLKDHIDAVYAVEFTPDGKRLVSCAADRTVKIWEVSTGKRLYTFSEATDGLNSLAIDPTGKLVAAGGADKSVRIWSMGDTGGELLHSAMAHEDAILRVAWSRDGKTIVSSAGKSVKALRASDLAEMKVFDNQSDWAYGVSFSPDGKQLFVGRFDGTTDLLDTASFQTPSRTAMR